MMSDVQKDRKGWLVINQLKSIHSLLCQGKYGTAVWAIEGPLREKLADVMTEEEFVKLYEGRGVHVGPDALEGFLCVLSSVVEYCHRVRADVPMVAGVVESEVS